MLAGTAQAYEYGSAGPADGIGYINMVFVNTTCRTERQHAAALG
jgi:hypothetical protein